MTSVNSTFTILWPIFCLNLSGCHSLMDSLMDFLMVSASYHSYDWPFETIYKDADLVHNILQHEGHNLRAGPALKWNVTSSDSGPGVSEEAMAHVSSCLSLRLYPQGSLLLLRCLQSELWTTQGFRNINWWIHHSLPVVVSLPSAAVVDLDNLCFLVKASNILSVHTSSKLGLWSIVKSSRALYRAFKESLF